MMTPYMMTPVAALLRGIMSLSRYMYCCNSCSHINQLLVKKHWISFKSISVKVFISHYNQHLFSNKSNAIASDLHT